MVGLLFDNRNEPVTINESNFYPKKIMGKTLAIDAVVNTIHGTPGEDGKLQGYFDVLGVKIHGL